MDGEYLYPEEIDRRLNWPSRTAARLVRKGKLPHYKMPDGSIRLVWRDIAPLIQKVEPLEDVLADGIQTVLAGLTVYQPSSDEGQS